MNHATMPKNIAGILAAARLFCQRLATVGNHGAALIGIVVTITMAAALGAAMVGMLNTSTMVQIGSLDSTRAYYLAEAGGRHAIRLITEQEFGTPPYASRAALITALNNQTFTMSDNSQFALTLSYTDPLFTLTSTGMPHSSAARKITYLINTYQPPGGSEGVELPFDANPSDSDALNPANWNEGGGTEVKSEGRLELDADGTDAFASIDWTNASSTMPDLGEVWDNSDDLLSYEIQTKVNLKNKDQVGGISFRLDTNASADIANHDFYGYSFLHNKSGDSDLPAFVDRNAAAVAFSGDTAYLILWKQNSGTRTILEKIPVPASFRDGSEVEDYTGLIIRVQEQYDNSGNRENLITAYLADADSYDSGDIHWDYSQFTLVDWGCSDAAAYNCTSGAGCTCIVDTTFTSANFITNHPDEIGVHGLGADEIRIRDLAVRFGFDGGKRTQY